MGLRVISLDEYVNSLKSGKKIKNAVVLTFDDGYDDSYLYAFPVLKKYAFPAIIFIIEKHVGVNYTFLKDGQIKEMAKNGIAFGSHTINHVYLPGIKNEEGLKNEIAGSKKLLEKRLAIPIDYFSYPVGGYNERIILLVKQAGYKAALTSNRGEGKFNQNIFALKRIKISGKENYFIFWLKISGYFNIFAKSVNPE
jgi:peptidoglycan/xylan/chitin deacetylase (PgdA/CDA1 family)